MSVPSAPENSAHNSPEQANEPAISQKTPSRVIVETDVRRRVLWTSVPAAALLALSFLPFRDSLPLPVGSAANGITRQPTISADKWVVPSSETLIISRQAAGEYSLLRGHLRMMSGAIVASPASGEIVQVLVSPGQPVRAGQRIVLLATGAVAPVEEVAPLDRVQSRAEAAQIAAAKQQEKLESRMVAAHEELERAKARVAEAQSRVASAREMVRRLKNGEDVTGEESTPARAADSSKQRSSEANAAKANAAKAAALKESRQLQTEAEAAEAKAKAAASAARDAEAALASRQQKLSDAQAAAKNAASTSESKTNENKAGENKTGDEKSGDSDKTDGAASKPAGGSANLQAVTAARRAVESASTHAAEARRDADRSQARAAELRKKANDAARRATQNLQLFDGNDRADSSPPAPARNVKSSGRKITIADAARIARAAMAESDAAIADAERLRRRIETYERPVQRTRRRFDAATRDLQAAQQRFWDNAPTMRVNQSPITTNRDGIITWVAAAPRTLRAGEPVAGVGRPDQLEVTLEDKSDVWKTLKPKTQVLALVQRQTVQRQTIQPPAGNPQSASDQQSAADQQMKATPISALRPGESPTGIPTLARVLDVLPPARPGGAAKIRFAVHNPPDRPGNNSNGLSPRAFAPGMAVFFSLARPGKKTALRVPTAAIRKSEDGKTFVAILASVNSAAADRLADLCRVEWREVTLGPGDGVTNPVKLGLKEGERIALRPNALYDYTLVHGAEATVSVEQI